MSQPNIPDALSDFEKALRGLQPKCEPDRDRLMYEAGRRSIRRGRFWPATSGALAAALVASLWLRGPTHETMYVSLPLVVMRDDVGSASYFRIRNAVLRDGPDALPLSTQPASVPNAEQKILNSRSREDV